LKINVSRSDFLRWRNVGQPPLHCNTKHNKQDCEITRFLDLKRSNVSLLLSPGIGTSPPGGEACRASESPPADQLSRSHRGEEEEEEAAAGEEY